MTDTELHSHTYEGNGSTATGYNVTFPFADLAHLKCGVTLDGETEETELVSGQYTVHTGVGGVYIRTATAYPSTASVRVFRRTPKTQGLSLPTTGAISPPSVERALDKLTYIAQEQASGGGTGSAITPELLADVMSFADPLARAATPARRAGQLAVQLSDDTIWISQSTLPGDWAQFAPTPTSGMSNRLVFLATADAGTPGDRQNAIISRAYEWAVDGIACGGDNHYTGTFDQAWAAFSAFIADGKIDRALGNHDKDDWTADNAKFAYLPANPNGHRRYYKRSHGNGLLDIFVLHSGRDSSWNAIEPDGNYPGSAQHAWFVAQLAASTARWKIVVMHHPPVTASVEANRADVNLDWPEFAQVDGVFVGHVHFSEWLTCRGTPIVNVSGGVARGGDVSDLLNLTGVDAIGSNLLWHDDRRGLLAKLTITPTRFLVSYHKIMTGELVYQRDLSDKTAHRSEWGAEVVGPGSLVPENTVLVGICPVPLCRGAWVISVAIPGNAVLAGHVLVDGAVAGEWSLAAGEFWVEVDSLRNIRRGARVQVAITSNAAYGAWYGLAVYYKGQMVG